MRPLRKFVSLSPAERRLLVTVVLLLTLIRLGLKLLPFRTLWRLLSKGGPIFIGCFEGYDAGPDRIAWAVTVAGRYVLGVRPCLAQALTAQLLLRWQGCPARLHFGVARDDRGQVQAHAWVEANGRVVIGGSASELERYIPLLAVDANSA